MLFQRLQARSVPAVLVIAVALLAGCSDEAADKPDAGSRDAGLNDLAVDPDVATDCSEVTVVTLESTIDQPTTLTGVNGCVDYRISSTVNVRAALTIEPGVQVVVDQGRRLTVTTGGSISAVGTQGAPIIFEGANPSAGFWDGINVESLNDTNELTWVEISDGGDGGWSNVYVQSTASVKITNSTLANSASSGLIAESGAVLRDFSSNTFVGNGEAALKIAPEQIGSLDSDSTYLGDSAGAANQAQVIDVIAGSVTSAQTWPATDAPFRLAGSTTIRAPVALASGFHAVARQGARLNVSTGGSLTANGTQSDHVRFSGENASPGFWDGLNIESKSSDNVLDYVDISEGGDGSWSNLYVQSTASVSIRNSSFSNSKTAGAHFETGASINAFESNTFANNQQAALQIGFDQIGSLDGASRYNGAAGTDDDNALPYVDVRATTLTSAQTWPSTDTPFRVSGSSTIRAAVTVSPGAQFVASAGARINIGTEGSLKAVAEAASVISFVGQESTPGYWDGLNFESTNSDNELKFVTITDGGDGGWANIYLQSTGSLKVTDCTISGSATYGIEVERGGSITPSTGAELNSQNTLSGNASGPVMLN